jgi:hypothetical protein
MQAFAGDITAADIREGVANARIFPESITDFRASLCRFEDDLFAEYPAGHQIVPYDAAVKMIGEVFRACGKPAPTLEMVPGFDDPKIGGFADVARHRIKIETGFLYRFLILHECAHILVPQDRKHGHSFTYVLQLLYRALCGIPEETIQRFLERHGLPGVTALAAPPEALRLAS